MLLKADAASQAADLQIPVAPLTAVKSIALAVVQKKKKKRGPSTVYSDPVYTGVVKKKDGRTSVLNSMERSMCSLLGPWCCFRVGVGCRARLGGWGPRSCIKCRAACLNDIALHNSITVSTDGSNDTGNGQNGDAMTKRDIISVMIKYDIERHRAMTSVRADLFPAQ